MVEPVPRFYWDACVFISYIEKTQERLRDIDGLFEKAVQGKIEIITSTFTISEVAFDRVEKDGMVLDLAIEEKIQNLWIPPTPIMLVEYHKLIANKAKGLIREGLPRGWSLKPADATHLATAQQMGVQALHTYNDELDKYGELLGFKVERPLIDQLSLL